MFKGAKTKALATVALAGALAAAALGGAACGGPVRTPATSQSGGQAIPANYPPSILESKEHRDTMVVEWQRLFDTASVPTQGRVVPELQMVTHTPQSTLGTGPIPLPLGAGEVMPIAEERVRLLLREFIFAHAQLLGVNASALSLEGVVDTGATGKRYSFVQTDYARPVLAPFGRLEIIVTPKGQIIQISDTVIPRAELPAEPRVTREAAAEKVLNTVFTYGDIAGRPQTVTVSDPKHITVKRLVVYPEVTETAMRVRLAWEVEAGDSLAWSVYVDAITGEKFATRQNFQT